MTALPRFALAPTLLIFQAVSWAEQPPLREFILSSTSEELELDFPSEPWVIVKETALKKEAHCTIILITGGAVNLDCPGIVAVISADHSAAITDASERLFSEVSKNLAKFSEIDTLSAFPAPGISVIYVRRGGQLLRREIQGDDDALKSIVLGLDNLITIVRQEVLPDCD